MAKNVSYKMFNKRIKNCGTMYNTSNLKIKDVIVIAFYTIHCLSTLLLNIFFHQNSYEIE